MVAFDALDTTDGGEGTRRWEEAGRPLVPSLVVGGAATPILHRSQLAALLGLPAAEEGEAAALAWDCAVLLGAWVTAIRELPLALLAAPTPSRGRSLRNLTVNVFHPFELLPAACAEGRFDWDPEGDAGREEALAGAAAVVRYAVARRDGWLTFLAEHADVLDAAAPVTSPRGTVALGALLAQQRWHAAYHYRQLTAFLDAQGAAVAGRLDLAGLAGLDLPDAVY